MNSQEQKLKCEAQSVRSKRKEKGREEYVNEKENVTESNSEHESEDTKTKWKEISRELTDDDKRKILAKEC